MKKLLSLLTSIIFILNVSQSYAFSDVPSQATYAPALEFLQNQGAITASDDKFLPNQPISRQDFLKWALDSYGFMSQTTIVDKFPCLDLASDSPFMIYFYEAIKIGLFPEIKNSQCQPHQTLTRVSALQKLFYLYGLPTPRLFSADNLPKDVKANSPIAPLINAALVKKVISLDENKMWKPYKKLLRAEAADLMLNMAIAVGNYTPKDKPSVGDDSWLHSPEKIKNADILLNALEQIRDHYYFGDAEKITSDNIAYKVIAAFIKELKDPFSGFDEPSKSAVKDSLEGNFEGVGIRIVEDQEKVSILNVIKNSPAANSGLKAKDIIQKINDEDATKLTMDEIAEKVRGPAGTTVKITILRPDTDQILDFNLTRATITVTQVESKILQGNIAYFGINVFGDKTLEEFTEALKTVIKPDTKGLVIDLRDNPGGYLDTVQKLLEYFIPKNKALFHIKDKQGKITSTLSAGTGELAKYPLVVLINKGSASSSEIFALAIQDYKLGPVIGVTSFGKGTVQEVISYVEGSTLRLTTFEWLSPNQKSVNKIGIKPDIEVDLTKDDLAKNQDPQLSRALDELRKQ